MLLDDNLLVITVSGITVMTESIKFKVQLLVALYNI